MTSEERKQRPVARGFLDYFPKAVMETAYHSWKANDKHNPGEELHWAKEKSTDHVDALARHIMDYLQGERYDEDGLRILTAISWRAMAFVETELEKEMLHENYECEDCDFCEGVRQAVKERDNGKVLSEEEVAKMLS